MNMVKPDPLMMTRVQMKFSLDGPLADGPLAEAIMNQYMLIITDVLGEADLCQIVNIDKISIPIDTIFKRFRQSRTLKSASIDNEAQEA